MLKIVQTTALDEKTKKAISLLYPQIFESFNAEKVFDKFSFHTRFLVLLAHWENTPVGFKIGYGQDMDLFYSWTGGVLPEHRKKGIASALMQEQHLWCKDQGYKRIETRSRNKFQEMLKLNFQHSFKIVGTFTDTDQEPKIILRKELL